MALFSIDELTSGQWLLTSADADLRTQPVHGMKLVFRNEPAGLRGCRVNWNNGHEVQLTGVTFDGITLEIQMAGVSPSLKMEVVGDDAFIGSWIERVVEGVPAPRLRMIKLAD
jgi:hypothetical protein